MPQFVVLQHDAPEGRHWDFMLEARDALATWALSQPPDADSPITAKALADHRLAYLEYEGPVSDDRGSVARWDRGAYQLQRYDRDEIIAIVSGKNLVGEVTLRRSPDDPQQWTFSYTPYV